MESFDLYTTKNQMSHSKPKRRTGCQDHPITKLSGGRREHCCIVGEQLRCEQAIKLQLKGGRVHGLLWLSEDTRIFAEPISNIDIWISTEALEVQ